MTWSLLRRLRHRSPRVSFAWGCERITGDPGRMAYSRTWRIALMLTCVTFGSAGAWAQDSVTVPLDPNPDGSGFDNYITVSVGGGPASEVLLDTGSTGLRIRREDIGKDKDVRITDQVVTYGYSSGNELVGVLGFAPVTFPDASSPLATPGPIA